MRSVIEKSLQCTTRKYDEFTTTIEHRLDMRSVTNVVDSAFEDISIDYAEDCKQQAVLSFCHMLMGDEVMALKDLLHDMYGDKLVDTSYLMRLDAIIEEII